VAASISGAPDNSGDHPKSDPRDKTARNTRKDLGGESLSSKAGRKRVNIGEGRQTDRSEIKADMRDVIAIGGISHNQRERRWTFKQGNMENFPLRGRGTIATNYTE
jgi:hypothetical protein